MNILKIAGASLCAVIGSYFIILGTGAIGAGLAIKPAEREGLL